MLVDQSDTRVQVSGVPMGDIWGDIDVKTVVSADGKDLSATVTVPSFVACVSCL